MIFAHLCRCGRWGGWGFGFRSRRDLMGTWFCREHKAEGSSIPEFEMDDDRYFAGVPSRNMRRCELCRRPIDVREVGTHQWTCGWVKLRAGGGGHGVSLPIREPRFAHDACVRRVIEGWDKRQLALSSEADWARRDERG